MDTVMAHAPGCPEWQKLAKPTISMTTTTKRTRFLTQMMHPQRLYQRSWVRVRMYSNSLVVSDLQWMLRSLWVTRYERVCYCKSSGVPEDNRKISVLYQTNAPIVHPFQHKLSCSHNKPGFSAMFRQSDRFQKICKANYAHKTPYSSRVHFCWDSSMVYFSLDCLLTNRLLVILVPSLFCSEPRVSSLVTFVVCLRADG